MEFFSSVFGLVTLIGGIVAVAVVGALYVAGLWKGKKDEADDRLIKILQTTVGELEKKVGHLEKREQELTKEVHELRNENKRYIEILENRDKHSQEFYTQAFDSMKISKETHALVVSMAQGMQSTNSNIEKMIDLLSKHTDMVDHAITNKK